MCTANIEIAKEFSRIFEEEPGKVEKWLRWADAALKLLAKEIPVQHVNAQDVVNTIILNTIDDIRKWVMDELPINVFMYNTIKSEVSNCKQKEKKRIFDEIKDDAEDEYQLYKNTHETVYEPDLVINIENTELIELCEKAIDEDYDCSLVFEAMKEVDPGKNKLISEATGIPVSKVENIKKVLFRKLNKVLSNYKN